jgi:hypothetical protein
MNTTILKYTLILSVYNSILFTFLYAFFMSHPANISRQFFFPVALASILLTILISVLWAMKSKKKTNVT